MNGFLVTVEGDYYGTPRASDRKKEKFPYWVQVKVPKPEGALSLIKNKLLDKVLRRKYGNYHTYRTHQITSITQLDGSKVFGLTDPRLMDFNDLAVYVQQKRLPLKLDLYTDLDYFRTMVYLAETNLTAFKVKQIQLEKDVSIDRELAELNPELSQPSETSQPNVTKQTLTAPDRNPLVDRTSIIQKENDGAVAPELAFSKVLNEAPASTIVTEEKPPAQKVEKVYVEGKGYVDAKDFKENFEKEEEKEYEVYDPTNLKPAPSESGLYVAPQEEARMVEVQAEQNEVQAEPDDINVDEL